VSINKYNAEGYADPTSYEALTKISEEEKKAGYRPLVFICSPFAGDVDANVRNAQRYCRFAVEQKAIPVAPHLFFPQFMNDKVKGERDLALFMGRMFLIRCTALWVFGSRITNGMAGEIHKAKCRGITIRYFNENCEEIENERAKARHDPVSCGLPG